MCREHSRRRRNRRRRVVVTVCGRTCLNPVNRKRKYTTTRTQNEKLATGNGQLALLAGPRQTDGMQQTNAPTDETDERRREGGLVLVVAPDTLTLKGKSKNCQPFLLSFLVLGLTANPRSLEPQWLNGG